MALRIKSHWHNDESERSMEEIAGAIGFIAWKIAKDKAINLHGEDFVYNDDRQRLSVIQEYLIFQLQLADRIAHENLDEDERRALIIGLAKRLASLMQENSEEALGPGPWGNDFIALLNERAEEYSEFSFTNEDGPSYPFFRHLGFEIQQIMGESQDNRWVIDQVMDKDGPDVSRQITRAVENLFG